MNIRFLITITIITLPFLACVKGFDCSDAPIDPVFIGFSSTDIDTFVLRKYKPNDNFQHLLDTSLIVFGYAGLYYISHDTTTVWLPYEHHITSGFDWQLFVPSKNKTIVISDVQSEKKTGSCQYGIFSWNHSDCACINKVFSAKVDNQLVTFPNLDTVRNKIYIRN